MQTGRTVAAVALLVAAGALGGASPAVAGPAPAAVSVASVQVVAGKIVFQAYPGVANDVDVSPDAAGDVEIYDLTGAIDLIGPGCTHTPDLPLYPHEVTCARAGLTGLWLDGGDLDDTLYVRDPMSATLFGDDGDDTLYGAIGDDVLDGGPGADALSGSIGDDRLDGGPGDDTLAGGPGVDLMVGGPGADQFDGAAGVDTVSYAGYAAGVVVDADGQPGDDGATGERDSVDADVEKLVGGAGADVLVGNDLANGLNGGGGADRLYGLAGADTLYGEAGADHLDGGSGPAGSTENDVCVPGADGATLAGCEVVRR